MPIRSNRPPEQLNLRIQRQTPLPAETAQDLVDALSELLLSAAETTKLLEEVSDEQE